jgi:hypothetical protein
VKDDSEGSMSWQLTGVVFVDNSIIVADSQNDIVDCFHNTTVSTQNINRNAA